MDELKGKALQEFLLLHGASLESLSQTRVTQFSKVYDTVERRKQAIRAAKSSIAENSVTVLAVAKEAGISRKTFYNNPLLKQYVEEQAAEIEMIKTPTKDMAEHREMIAGLEEQIRLLTLRDLDTLKLEHQISELSRELIEKNSRIINLEKEYEKVCEALREARSQIPSKRAEILPFKRD